MLKKIILKKKIKKIREKFFRKYYKESVRCSNCENRDRFDIYVPFNKIKCLDGTFKKYEDKCSSFILEYEIYEQIKFKASKKALELEKRYWRLDNARSN